MSDWQPLVECSDLTCVNLAFSPCGRVDLEKQHPGYFIAPRWWVRNDIWQTASAYLALYENKHRHPRESQQHAITASRVEQR
jgi:hypothetical protein